MHWQNMRVLVVADLAVLPYRVLFCLRDAGVRNVYVLGSTRSRRLRFTRFCKRIFITKTNFTIDDPENALSAINHHVRELNIDIVLPGDQHSTHLLTMIKPNVATACFPLPIADQYDVLHNKWNFFSLCRDQNVLCPETVLLPDAASLMDNIQAKTIACPIIVKPLNFEAGNGILKITEKNARQQVRRIDYQPILTQRFIEGEDIGASVYCEDGAIRNFIAHSFKRQVYQTFHNDAIYSSIARILSNMRVSGVFNFDMRLTSKGEIYFIECNPRFFAKMAMSALAGVNFVAAGLGLPTKARAEDNVRVKMPLALGFDLLTKPRYVSRRDIFTTLRLVADPVPFAVDLFRAGWSDLDMPINYYREMEKPLTARGMRDGMNPETA